MIKRPLILGCRGNMGKRYAAVLNYLGIDHLGVDIGDEMPTGYDGIIICTPTANHINDVEIASLAGVPILCEKPFSTDLEAVLLACDRAEKLRVNLTMVNQYRFMGFFNESVGPTEYNYFKTGRDGLAWDCISVVALAKGAISLNDSAPYWHCVINGKTLSAGKVDMAYVDMLKAWLNYPRGDIDYIRMAHRKVSEYLKQCQKS